MDFTGKVALITGDVTGTHIVIDGGRSASGGVALVKKR